MGDDRADAVAVSRRRVTREFLILVALVIAAVASFIVTRKVAEHNRSIRVADADVWFSTGRQALGGGEFGLAAVQLRKATLLNPDRIEYRLALARALIAGRRDTDAHDVLASVLLQRPDDPEANLQLARLGVRAGHLDEAVRLYQRALVAFWSPSDSDRRRQTRLELIDYLLQQRSRGRALSELLLLNADLPDDVETRVGIGRRLLSAGDAQRASVLFEQVLEDAPSDAAALAGAGEAAFALGNYAAALRALASVPDTTPGVADTRALARLVLDRDPLAPRLGASERLRRVGASAADLIEPLDSCIGARPVDPAAAVAALEVLRAELEGYAHTLVPRKAGATRVDTGAGRDAAEEGLNVLLRVVRGRADAHCGPPLAIERALRLIGGRHGIDGA